MWVEMIEAREKRINAHRIRAWSIEHMRRESPKHVRSPSIIPGPGNPQRPPGGPGKPSAPRNGRNDVRGRRLASRLGSGTYPHQAGGPGPTAGGARLSAQRCGVRAEAHRGFGNARGPARSEPAFRASRRAGTRSGPARPDLADRRPQPAPTSGRPRPHRPRPHRPDRRLEPTPAGDLQATVSRSNPTRSLADTGPGLDPPSGPTSGSDWWAGRDHRSSVPSHAAHLDGLNPAGGGPGKPPRQTGSGRPSRLPLDYRFRCSSNQAIASFWARSRASL